MSIQTEEQYTGEFLLTEGPGELSRSNVTVTVPASTKMKAGSVLGKITASGKYTYYDDDNTNGTETAKAILFAPLDNSAGVAPADFGAVVIDGVAEVRKADLNWAGTVDSGDKTAAYADLAAIFIKARG